MAGKIYETIHKSKLKVLDHKYHGQNYWKKFICGRFGPLLVPLSTLKAT